MDSVNAEAQTILTRIRVREPGTRIASFIAGDIGQPLAGRSLWYLCCPACGWGTYVGRTHGVLQNKDGTVTITPALVCSGSQRRFNDPLRCTARYRIDHNIIHWIPRTSHVVKKEQVKKS